MRALMPTIERKPRRDRWADLNPDQKFNQVADDLDEMETALGGFQKFINRAVYGFAASSLAFIASSGLLVIMSRK